jgi:hypothetical protein
VVGSTIESNDISAPSGISSDTSESNSMLIMFSIKPNESTSSLMLSKEIGTFSLYLLPPIIMCVNVFCPGAASELKSPIFRSIFLAFLGIFPFALFLPLGFFVVVGLIVVLG